MPILLLPLSASGTTGVVSGTATASSSVTGARSDSGAVTGTATATGAVTAVRADVGQVVGTATALGSVVPVVPQLDFRIRRTAAGRF